MLGELAKQFLGSGAATDAIKAVTAGTSLNQEQATRAVEATAEGAAETAGSGGLGALTGALGGGGGLAGLAGGLLGAGGGQGGVPPELAKTVAKFVADKTGLGEDMAQSAVQVALPKILEYFQGKGGSGGPLGGLLG